MLTIKPWCSPSVLLFLAVTISTGSNAAEGDALEIVRNTSCVDQLNADALTAIKGQYIDAKTNTFPVQVLSLDLNGDQYCDLLVEFQGDYSACEEDPAEACSLTKQGRWTNFYFALSHNQYGEEAISATRDRWTAGGKYVSYKVKDDTAPFIVWDLRSNGRVEEYADSYTVFQLSDDIEVLDAGVSHNNSIPKEKAQKILEFHNQEFSK